MKTLTILFLLAFAFAAHAADICVGAACQSTTPRQDAGALFVCERRTGATCTAAQARDMVLNDTMTQIEEHAQLREREQGQDAGINKAFLHIVAQEPSISVAAKCAVMADQGVQTAYESIYNVTCP